MCVPLGEPKGVMPTTRTRDFIHLQNYLAQAMLSPGRGVHMGADQRDLLTVLKAELEFLSQGGYRRNGASSWRPSFIFEDSPSCLNYKDPSRAKPCSECVLMQLVPPEKRKEQIPCRFIPLDALGTTVESLYKTATQDELEAEVRNWLKARIEAMEEKEQLALHPESGPQKAKVCA